MSLPLCLDGSAWPASGPASWTWTLWCARAARKPGAAAAGRLLPPERICLCRSLSSHPLAQNWGCISQSDWAWVTYVHSGWKQVGNASIGYFQKLLLEVSSASIGACYASNSPTIGRRFGCQAGETRNWNSPCLFYVYPSNWQPWSRGPGWVRTASVGKRPSSCRPARTDQRDGSEGWGQAASETYPCYLPHAQIVF